MLQDVGMIWVAYRRDDAEVQALLEDPERVEELLDEDDDEASVEVDKAWHGIHWLLTGSGEPTDSPLSDVIFGGRPFGEDLGFGPARVLAAAGVVRVAGLLGSLDDDVVRGRMDSAAMQRAQLYPEIWDEVNLFDEYVLPALQRLRRFYKAAAESGESVIQTLC
jgi:hypothetical protein